MLCQREGSTSGWSRAKRVEGEFEVLGRAFGNFEKLLRVSYREIKRKHIGSNSNLAIQVSNSSIAMLHSKGKEMFKNEKNDS